MSHHKNVLGLIAGQGRLPFIVADGAKQAGLKVVCVGLAGSVDPSLAGHVDHFFYGAVARPGGWMRTLRKNGVRDAIMVGRVAKSKIYTPNRIIRYVPDWRALRIWYWRLRKMDKRNDSVLCAIADELASGDIILKDSTMHIKDHMADEDVMTTCQPPASVWEDIQFGWDIVKRMGDLDIGQAIAVKEREVISVEAMEGTAQMIKRTGQLCRKGGWTLIKTAKPNQDMRFDVPCVGVDTIESLKENNARCLVVEKEKVIIIDKPQTIALANKLGIAIVGY